MGFAGASLYRFDAPVPDCLNYAASLIEENNRTAPDEKQKAATNLVQLATAPTPISRHILEGYGLTKVHWFDVESIKSGVAGRGPPGARGRIWIDTERGRFYYYWTD